MDKRCTTRFYKRQDNRSSNDSNRTVINRRGSSRDSIHSKNMHGRKSYPLYCSCRKD